MNDRFQDVLEELWKHDPDRESRYPFMPGTRRRVPGLGWIIDDAGTITPEMFKKLREIMGETQGE